MSNTDQNIHAIEQTLSLLSGKWIALIIYHLLDKGVLRQCDFKKLFPTISQKMLTKQLRFLEEKQIITRQIYSEIPPKVTYTLTQYGSTLEQPLNALKAWGKTKF